MEVLVPVAVPPFALAPRLADAGPAALGATQADVAEAASATPLDERVLAADVAVPATLRHGRPPRVAVPRRLAKVLPQATSATGSASAPPLAAGPTATPASSWQD